MQKTENKNFAYHLKRFFISCGIGLFISFILLIIFSLILSNTDINDNISNIFTIITNAICFLVSSLIYAKIEDIRGIYLGIIMFFGLVIIKLLISLIAFDIFTFDNFNYLNLIFDLVFSVAGGVVGANLRK